MKNHTLKFPISIRRTSLFQILRVLGGIFNFNSNSDRTFCELNSGDCDQTLRSDHGLHCLPLSHKKDARLIWFKACFKNVIGPGYDKRYLMVVIIKI